MPVSALCVHRTLNSTHCFLICLCSSVLVRVYMHHMLVTLMQHCAYSLHSHHCLKALPCNFHKLPLLPMFVCSMASMLNGTLTFACIAPMLSGALWHHALGVYHTSALYSLQSDYRLCIVCKATTGSNLKLYHDIYFRHTVHRHIDNAAGQTFSWRHASKAYSCLTFHASFSHVCQSVLGLS